MNDQQIDDLKQFISVTIAQTEANLDNKIDGLATKVSGLDARVSGLDARVSGLDDKIESLRQDMLDGFAGVAEVIEELQNRYDDNNKVIDHRLTQLEQKAV
jgi:uncharacterized protein YoxC